MPPPPPRPPPPPGPPPPSSASVQHGPKPVPASTDRSAVLADIRKGAQLKKVSRTEIKDRSSPLVAGNGNSPAVSASPSDSSNGLANSRGSKSSLAGENGNRRPPGGLGNTGSPMSLQEELEKKFRRYQGQSEKVSPTEEVPVPQPVAKPYRPAAPAIPNGFSREVPNPPPPPPVTKPAFNSVRRYSLTDNDSSQQVNGSANGSAPLAPKPAPTPKPASLVPGNLPNGINYGASGAQTMHIHRSMERKPLPNMGTVPPQKPKHPPPPLPTNPPPSRNISQTMPRPVKHNRPSLPENQRSRTDDAPPSPPPVPGRPPSFRQNDRRPSNLPPPPPPVMVINDVDGNRSGLISNVQQKPPPSRPPALPPAPPVTGLGMPHSSSVHSLPGSPSVTKGSPKRHDSLSTIVPDQNNRTPQQYGTMRGAPGPPPLPPSRQGSSPGGSRTFSLAQEFEMKFAFHAINELPPPARFSGDSKTYPSAKNRTRPLAPAPPIGQVR